MRRDSASGKEINSLVDAFVASFAGKQDIE
jgi:hypothetical protein